ncbi:uncharacterized protein B0H18DRAFT_978148 [Fomitopsis serialis]|uniref:uncharacterized protein n=1 Tax=Fomitopsis serialis TaxID=139415 RepID=UPI00200807DC|nr:uncharacterized protein B0H18DRAFT_978148 [Neoantrodia serialis]KAH9934769.1 hypothetical protein B0H18DRAFT_978148 [Neoantrodia serialis]
MALPSRPNARVGLPTNPRSRSLARRPSASVDIRFSREDMARQYVPSRPAPTPPPVPQMRPARSMTDLRAGAPRSRSLDRGRVARPVETPPPLPIAPSARQAREAEEPHKSTEGSFASLKRYVTQRKRTDGSITSWGSSSSESSTSGNSLRSYTSFASSQTSLADDDMKNTSPTGQPTASGSAPGSPESPPSSLGSSLWTRVATAAEHLKVNVSKAISIPVTTENGENTPDGQESSLAKAMKAYHVDKANGDAKELPDWLFEGRDREIINRLRGPSLDQQQPAAASATRANVVSPVPRSITASPAPERGRSRAPGTGIREGSIPRRDDSATRALRESVASIHATVPSRDNMNRLKDLRLAKRNARVRFEGQDEEEVPEPVPSRAPSRAGMARHVAPPSAFKDMPMPEVAPLRIRPKERSQERQTPAAPVAPPGGSSLQRRPTGLPTRAPSREGRRSSDEPTQGAPTPLVRRTTGLPVRAPNREERRYPEESFQSNAAPLARRPTGLPARAPSREGRRIGLPGSVRPQRI